MRVAVGSLLLLIASGGIYHLRGAATAHFVATQEYEDIYYVPPGAWLPTLSLGHREALADLLWMRALVYFGDELRQRGQVRHVLRYADAILALDPQFGRVYRWAGTSGMYHTGEVTLDDIRASIEFLKRGARVFPDDGEMAWDLGASLLYELLPHLTDEAERTRTRAMGVAHMQTAARLGAGPDWLALSNATELRRLGQTEKAIRHLEEMYSLVRDDAVRETIGEEIASLRDQATAQALRHASEQFERSRRRDFPYMSPDLYLLVGDRPALDPRAYDRGLGWEPPTEP